MAWDNGYDVYKQADVKTAGRGNLIVMLYEEAIRQISAAIVLFEDGGRIPVPKIEKFNSHIVKAQAIITELEASLNIDAGGEIAQNLLNLYLFFNQELVDGNIHRDVEKLVSVRSMMSDLCTTWRKIANQNVNQTQADFNIHA